MKQASFHNKKCSLKKIRELFLRGRKITIENTQKNKVKFIGVGLYGCKKQNKVYHYMINYTCVVKDEPENFNYVFLT